MGSLDSRSTPCIFSRNSKRWGWRFCCYLHYHPLCSLPASQQNGFRYFFRYPYCYILCFYQTIYRFFRRSVPMAKSSLWHLIFLPWMCMCTNWYSVAHKLQRKKRKSLLPMVSLYRLPGTLVIALYTQHLHN